MTAPSLPESLLAPLPSVEDAYRMGRDYSLNGPNDDNCHFRLFHRRPAGEVAAHAR